MYKFVLFDMDGTLVNTYQGIYHSYEYAAKKLGIEFQGEKFVGNVIGVPLMSVFTDWLLLSQEDARKGIEYYRKYYAERGKNEASVYEGIKESLSKLKREEYVLGIATLKRETFAEEILKNLGLDIYFDVVYGIDDNDSLTKSKLIEKCISKMHALKKDTILVGDSEYDYEGARAVEIDFLAVSYGFGFRDSEYFKKNKISLVAHSGFDIASILENLS